MESHDEPRNHADALLILTWTFMSLALLAMALRLWARMVLLNEGLRSSDVLMLAATAIQIGQSILLTMAFTHGLGRHFDTFTQREARTVVLFSQMSKPFGVIGPMLGRISVAVLLLQILVPHDKPKKALLWSLIGLQIVVNVYVLVELLAQCGTHIEATWDFYYRSASSYCLPVTVDIYSSYVHVAVCALTDLSLTILPWFVLRRINFRRQDRWGLVAVLSLSFFAFVAAIVRATQTINLFNANDFTWYFPNFMICIVVENNIVIIAGSMPTLRPLWTAKSGDTWTGMGICRCCNCCGNHSRLRKRKLDKPFGTRKSMVSRGPMQHAATGTYGSMIWTISTNPRPQSDIESSSPVKVSTDDWNTMDETSKSSWPTARRVSIITGGNRNSSGDDNVGEGQEGINNSMMRLGGISRTMSVDIQYEQLSECEPLPNLIAPWVNDGPTSEVSISS